MKFNNLKEYENYLNEGKDEFHVKAYLDWSKLTLTDAVVAALNIQSDQLDLADAWIAKQPSAKEIALALLTTAKKLPDPYHTFNANPDPGWDNYERDTRTPTEFPGGYDGYTFPNLEEVPRNRAIPEGVRSLEFGALKSFNNTLTLPESIECLIFRNLEHIAPNVSFPKDMIMFHYKATAECNEFNIDSRLLDQWPEGLNSVSRNEDGTTLYISPYNCSDHPAAKYQREYFVQYAIQCENDFLGNQEIVNGLYKLPEGLSIKYYLKYLKIQPDQSFDDKTIYLKDASYFSEQKTIDPACLIIENPTFKHGLSLAPASDKLTIIAKSDYVVRNFFYSSDQTSEEKSDNE